MSSIGYDKLVRDRIPEIIARSGKRAVTDMIPEKDMGPALDRKLQERRIFPAIDIVKSGTRREDLLLTERERKAMDILHRRMNGIKADEAVEQIINAFAYYPTNEQVVNAILQKWQPVEKQ